MFLHAENRDLSEPGDSITQQLKSFSRELLRHVAEACQITARSGDACDQAFAIRIGHAEEDDGYSCCGFLDGTGQFVRGNDERIWVGCSDFLCNARRLRRVRRATHHENTVVGFDISKITESVPEGSECGRRLIAPTRWRMPRNEDPDSPYLGRLLRSGDEWQAHHGQERSPVHC